ncbi:hypothetical protein GALL_153500 [mine drainage metagenome]|uniref:Uncharacterized protein n=1 Tax=mine drainage metagenome TaxID=410659 RepID=A0A1J5SLR5_9ZZZZ
MGLLGYALAGAAGGGGTAAQGALLEQQKAQLEEQKINYALQAQEQMKDLERSKIAGVIDSSQGAPNDDGTNAPATPTDKINGLLGAGYLPEANAAAQALKVSSYPDLFMQNLANKSEVENTKAAAQVQAMKSRGVDAEQIRANTALDVQTLKNSVAKAQTGATIFAQPIKGADGMTYLVKKDGSGTVPLMANGAPVPYTDKNVAALANVFLNAGTANNANAALDWAAKTANPGGAPAPGATGTAYPLPSDVLKSLGNQ